MESKDPETLDIKISDFGFACFFKPGEGKQEILGSPLYMAPEIVNEESYDEKVDIWSVGVIAYILLTGRAPFTGKSRSEIFTNIKTKPLSFDGLDYLS